MKKVLLFTLFTISLNTLSLAQNFEISGGFSANKMIGFDRNDFTPGFYFNTGYKFAITEYWGLRPTITFSQLGSKVSYTNKDENIDETYTVKVNGISIGSDVYCNASEKIEISGGLQLTYLMNLDPSDNFNEYIENEFNSEEYELKNLDLQLLFKFRYNVVKRFYTEGFFRQGLISLDDLNNSNLNTGLGIGVGFKL